jgi:hypothetical protein
VAVLSDMKRSSRCSAKAWSFEEVADEGLAGEVEEDAEFFELRYMKR